MTLEEIAAHEVAHKMLGEAVGMRCTGIYLSETEGGMTTFAEGSSNPIALLGMAVAGPVGQIIREDPSWRRFKTLATQLVESSSNDGRAVRIALAGLPEYLRSSKAEAIETVAIAIEEAVVELTKRGVEFEEEIEATLRGERTPMIPAGHFIDEQSGLPVYFAASPEPMPTDGPELADLQPWPDPEPPPRGPLHLLRNAAGKLVGIGREGDHLA